MLNINSKVKNLDEQALNSIKAVALSAMKILKQPIKNVCFNLYFVSEKSIRELNNSTRGIDKVTDVLSYPMLDIKAGDIINVNSYKLEIDPATNCLTVGEIVICNQKAISQAKKYGHSYLREVCFLFLHGLLHCLGYDHITEEERLVMEDMQRKILDKCNITR